MKHNYFKIFTSLLLAIMLVVSLVACGSGETEEETTEAETTTAEAAADETEEETTEAEEDDTSTITFVDSVGRSVVIDRTTDKIAAFHGPSYNYCLFLGQSGRVVTCMTMNSWAEELTENASGNVDSIEVTGGTVAEGLNVEELLEEGIGLIFYWPTKEDVLEECDSVGLTAVGIASNTDDNSATTMDEFIEMITGDANMYAEALGNGAEDIAEEYYEYVSEKLHMVEDALSGLTEDDIVDVYWMRSSDDGLQAFCAGSVAESICNVTYGNLVTTDVSGSGNVQNVSTYTTVTMEQIYEWDPDVIILGRTNDPTIVEDNEQWASISAVVNDEIYLCPTGAFYWDNGPELVLTVMYIAQILHPECLEDLDMVEEIQYFYSEFYGYDLTEEQAGYILNCLGPDGE